MDFLRPEIAALEQNGITRVALTRIGDPKVIPLWFGEGDSVTEEFIREAAKEALDAGDTFYTHTRGKQALRDALKRYLDALYGIDLDPDRITVPGATMLGITDRGPDGADHGRSCDHRRPGVAQHRQHVPGDRRRGDICMPATDGGRLAARSRRHPHGAPPPHPLALRQHALQPDRLGDARPSSRPSCWRFAGSATSCSSPTRSTIATSTTATWRPPS